MPNKQESQSGDAAASDAAEKIAAATAEENANKEE
uniref:Uncharacterized protein n=1 Tax=Panagrolaimus sp. ES5 TaxID=591445 RepID=A0AC34GBP9_9BILA